MTDIADKADKTDKTDMVNDIPPAPDRASSRRGRRAKTASALPVDLDVLRVGIYLRVSSPGQATEDKTSLAEQEKACRERAAELARRDGKRLVVVNVWTEVQSSVEERPVLAEAIRWARQGLLSTLIAYRVDRFMRDTTEMLLVNRMLENVSVRLAVCDTDFRYGKDDRMEQDSKLLLMINASMAERERLLILARFEDGRRGMAEGKHRQPQRAVFPYGYKIRVKAEAQLGFCTPSEVGTYVIIEEQAEVVREIYTRIAAGQTRYMVCRALQEKRIRAPKGGESWYPATVQQLIEDTLYKGEATYGKTTQRKNPERRLEGLREKYTVAAAPERVIHFPAPAIVSEELWQQANERLRSNQSRMSGKPENRYLLSGFLRCPLCGCAMVGKTVGSKNGAKVFYYVCNKRCADYLRASHDTVTRCKFEYLRGTVVESLFIEGFLKLVSEPDKVSRAIDAYKEEVLLPSLTTGNYRDRERRELAVRRDKAANEYRAAQDAIVRFIAMDPQADVSHLIEMATAHRQDRDACEELLANLSLSQVVSEVETRSKAFLEADTNQSVQWVYGLLAELPHVLLDTGIPVIVKRYLLDSAIDEVLPTRPKEGVPGHKAGAPDLTIKLCPELLFSPEMSSGQGSICGTKNESGIPHPVPQRPLRLPLALRRALPTLTLTIDHKQGVSCHVGI